MAKRKGVSDEFLEFLTDQLEGLGPVRAKRMFGGAGIYLKDAIFGLVADDVFYLKADESNRADFTTRGMGPFKPFPDKATTMPYYQVPPEILDDPDSLCDWSKKSLAAARNSPKRRKR